MTDHALVPGAQATNLAQALQQAAAMGLDRLDAQRLLLHSLGRPGHDRAWLLAHDADALAPGAWHSFQALCARCRDGEPMGYLLGQQEFHGLNLAVDPRVLVPRPDTETLVDWALVLLQPVPSPQLLDLGTGSGAIALALQQARPDASVHAIDASPDALDVARANAARLGLPVQFAHGHWLTQAGSGYHLIAANPPYIAEGDAHLPALRHEPHSALVAGPDGLADLRQIIASAPAHLRDGGWLLLEHGHDQAEAVCTLLAAHGYHGMQSRSDLAGIARCSGATWRQ
jgi:release factor glutamine methyltransferase